LTDENARFKSRQVYILSTLAGVFLAFLIPSTKPQLPEQSGIIGAVIAFELHYENLLTTIVAVWLSFVLLKQQIRPPRKLILCAGLGFAWARILLAVLSLIRK
jgi:hypothetical protein